jgi:RimJ/RimL family protein N-acetyltransferase
MEAYARYLAEHDPEHLAQLEGAPSERSVARPRPRGRVCYHHLVNAEVYLETQRLVLREFREDDGPAIHEYAADPEVVRYVEWGPNTWEETQGFLSKKLADRREAPRISYELALELKDEARLIGSCGLGIRQGLWDRTADIGYVLRRGYWHHGYTTEAALALVDFGFRRLQLHRIFATCDVRNVASARVLEKVGMRQEALFKQDRLQKGVWRDTYLYAILDEEWSAVGRLSAQARTGEAAG